MSHPLLGPPLLLLDCSERRGQSQKPEEIYQLIEQLVPNGGCKCTRRCAPHRASCWSFRRPTHAAIRSRPPSHCPLSMTRSRRCHCFFVAGKYLEIFGRKNNLRDYWVTVGNEVTGQGAPREDQRALEEGALRVPNAVYGRTG